MVRDFPRKELFKGPAPWSLVLTLAPIVQAFSCLCLDLLSRVKERGFISLRVSHYVCLLTLSRLLGLYSSPVLGLIVMRLFGIIAQIVLHQHRVCRIGDILKVRTISFGLIKLILTMGGLFLAKFHRLYSVRLIRFHS